MTYMQLRGVGHPCSILTGVLIFSRYFKIFQDIFKILKIFSRYCICKIGKGVRKASSHGFEMRPGFSAQVFSAQVTGVISISMTPATGVEKTWSHS